MWDLEVEKPETSCPKLKMTIFSWVLAPPASEQRAIEGPPCPVSPTLKMGSYGVPPHLLRSSEMIGTCWLSPPQWAN